MKAMVLRRPAPIAGGPLRMEERRMPSPKKGELLVRVAYCGVCRTDLHVVEGELRKLRPSVVPGHEIVGKVAALGHGARGFRVGDTVGVPWLYGTCGKCRYCKRGEENLCAKKEFTGYSRDGGYAEYVLSDCRYTFKIPGKGDLRSLPPLMCAGIVGYRAFKLARPSSGKRIGMLGFGASAHLTLQLARKLGYSVVVFSGNPKHRGLAKRLGAGAVHSYDISPGKIKGGLLDSAIVFAPSGKLISYAMELIRPGGKVVAADIYVEGPIVLDYQRHLFGEKTLTSVEANTREDALEYLGLASKLGIRAVTTEYCLKDANVALNDLKGGKISGAVVLKP